MINCLREIPPTAGLTLQLKDFLPAKKSLEASMAEYLNVSSAQIECSGTAALTVALLALKQQSHRQTVIISAYTCPWVPLAVIHCGLKPVVCDNKPDSFEFCENALANSCSADTLAVIATHLGGHVASNLQQVIQVAHQYGAYVIEDAAQSLGARFGHVFNGQAVGTVADIGFYSLGVGKGLTIFAGGVLVAKDASIRNALREASTKYVQKNISNEAKRVCELIGYYLFYRPFGIKWVFGLSLRRHVKRGNFIEAVGDDCGFQFPLHPVSTWRKNRGANALKRLPAFLKTTALQGQARIQKLQQIKAIKVINQAQDCQDSHPFIYLLMPSEQARDAALNKLWLEGLGVGRLFIHAIAEYNYLKPYFAQAHTPNANDFAARGLIISNSPWMRDQDFIKIQETLMKYAES